MKDLLMDMVDFVKYDIFKFAPPQMPEVDFKLDFQLHGNEQGYWITAKKLPGFIASGDSLEELREAVFDTLLVYHDVPRYHAKRLRDTTSLILSDGRVVQPPQPIFQVKVTVAS